MNRNSQSRLPGIKRSLTVILTMLLVSQLFAASLMAQNSRKYRMELTPAEQLVASGETRPRKIAPDLEAAVNETTNLVAEDVPVPVIIQLRKSETTTALVAEDSSNVPSDSAPILISDEQKREVRGKLKTKGGLLKKAFRTLGLVSAELPLSRIQELASDDDVVYISPDRPVEGALDGHVEKTTGTTNVRTIIPGNVDGTGIGVAVVDSGIHSNHNSLKASTGHPGVVYRKDFTGTNQLLDPYGHGTHVATIIAGSGSVGGGAYRGIAPGAKLLDLVVLDQNGNGSTSAVVAAIDWCIGNKAAYNIRVINLSLGTTAKDPYLYDPLCIGAYGAFNNGIVVVASAGNIGKDASGRKVYGGIHSPGIDPCVITVGAINTFGTNTRSDDVVTSYSSRGPTRGYYTDCYGARHYDNYIKPDLVAPGNKIIGARSNGKSGGGNKILSIAPSLATGSSTNTADKVMYLSGTSMAAPVVTGTVALMLQVNPSLPVNLVKTILSYSAQTLNGANTLEQGAGQVNTDGAVRLAKLFKQNLGWPAHTEPMLTGSLPSPQASTISGQTVTWGQGVITNYCFLYGSELMTKWQYGYSTGFEMDWMTGVSGNQIYADRTLVTPGVGISSGALTHYFSTLLSNGSNYALGIVLGDSLGLDDGEILPDGIVLGDRVILPDGIVLGDGILRGTYLYGDPGSAMQPVP